MSTGTHFFHLTVGIMKNTFCFNINALYYPVLLTSKWHQLHFAFHVPAQGGRFRLLYFRKIQNTASNEIIECIKNIAS